MKKFLIGVLAMIPVIVVLALSATGTLIAMTTPVNPESVVVRSENNTPIDREVKAQLNDADQAIVIDVLPAICYSKEIEYEYDEEYGTGKLDLVQEGDTNRYRIVPRQSGVARVIIRAKANYNAYAAVTFIIASEKIEEVRLYDGEGEQLQESVRALGQTRLYADVRPIDALSGSDVVWSSSAASVVEVTQNGVVRPVSRGYATVTVSARDKLGTRHDAKVEIDTTSALVGATKGYCSEPATVGWVRQNLVLDPEAEVEQTGEGTFTVRRGSDSIAVEVAQAQAGEIGFTDGLSVIYQNNGPSYAEVKELLTGQSVNAVLLSSDPGVLSVTGNELVPVGAGRVTLTASANGRTISKELVVKERPMTFDLNLTGADGKLGIGMTRVWGVEWFRLDEGSEVFTHEYPFGARGWNGENFDLSWSLDKPEYASVDQSGTITFSPEARGQSITVSACVMVDGRATDVKRSFTFHMTDREKAVNVEDYAALERLTNLDHGRMPVLQGDIVPGEEVSAHALGIYRGLLGNGFWVDFSRCQGRTANYSILQIRAKEWAPQGDGETILLEDVKVRGAATQEESANGGRGVYLNDTIDPVVMRHLEIRNTNLALIFLGGRDLLVEGCILGDCWNTQISVNTRQYQEGSENNRITLRNNVLKHSQGPAITVAADTWSPATYGTDSLPEIRIEGFLDIYNWIEPKALGKLLAGFDVSSVEDAIGAIIDPEELSNALGGILESIITSPAYEHVIYVDKTGKKWVMIGAFFLGAMMRVNIQNLIVEDPRLVALRMPLDAKSVGSGASWIFSILEIAMQMQGFTASNDCYMLTYDFQGKEPSIRPGDPVPNDQALYLRLQGQGA